MKEKIEKLKQKTLEEIKKATDRKNLEEIKIKALGKKGELTDILKGLKDLAQEERPKVGAWVNEAKASVEEFIKKREEEFKTFELNKKLENEKIDITLPGNKFKRGSIHPLNRVIEDMEDFFLEYNSEWFKSFYFDLAPVLSIPLYQTHKSKEFIYKEDILANLSSYEYEVMANGFDPALLSHEDACTPNIYKTQFIKRKGNTDEFNVTAHAYRGERRVTYVTKWGGDGRTHVIPVHWIEYFPVEKDTVMSINKNNQTRFEYNSTDHSKLSNLNTLFERGLVGILGYQALFDADEALGTVVAKEEGFNLEKTIADLERELDEFDRKQADDTLGYEPDDSKLKTEEKEVSADDIETGSDSEDSDEDDSFDID